MKKCNLLLFNVASCILASFGEAGENDDDNVWSTGGDTIFIRDMDQPAHRISPFWLSVSEALNSIEQAMDGTSDSCERSIMNMFNTTNSSLAKRSQLQMFDAWGKLPSGVFQNPLSVIMFGDYFECKQIEFMPMAYCYNEMFLKTHHQWRQIGAIGSCLPRECTDADIEHTLYQLLYNFTNTTHNQLKSPIVFKVHCQEDKDLEPGSMATIALLVVFVSLAVLATGLDLRRYHLRSRAAQALLSVSKTEPADPYYEDDTAAAARVPLMLRFGSDGSYHPTPPAYHPLLLTANHSDSTSARSINTSDNDRGPVGAQGELDDSDDDGALRVAVAAPKSTLEKVLRCFSPYQNVGRLFANRGVARDIGCACCNGWKPCFHVLAQLGCVTVATVTLRFRAGPYCQRHVAIRAGVCRLRRHSHTVDVLDSAGADVAMVSQARPGKSCGHVCAHGHWHQRAPCFADDLQRSICHRHILFFKRVPRLLRHRQHAGPTPPLPVVSLLHPPLPQTDPKPRRRHAHLFVCPAARREWAAVVSQPVRQRRHRLL
eukprot:m.524861 g.524861  ORF g.524861 m.524861 type:complete len:543 (-) comp21994_c0_seq2:1135-2763(-)